MFQQFLSDAARHPPPTPDPQGLKSKCGGVKCLGDKQRDSSGERLASGTYSAVVKLARKKKRRFAQCGLARHGTRVSFPSADGALPVAHTSRRSRYTMRQMRRHMLAQPRSSPQAVNLPEHDKPAVHKTPLNRDLNIFLPSRQKCLKKRSALGTCHHRQTCVDLS